jgi:hypothetical protein
MAARKLLSLSSVTTADCGAQRSSIRAFERLLGRTLSEVSPAFSSQLTQRGLTKTRIFAIEISSHIYRQVISQDLLPHLSFFAYKRHQVMDLDDFFM